MTSAWRTLLICALMLALPLQAMAAMRCCGVLQHAGTQAPAAAAVHHHSHHAADAAGPAADAVAHAACAHADRAGTHDAKPHGCGSCAACCAVAALTGVAPPPVAFGRAVAPRAEPPAALSPFAIGGPDRPPRQRLV